MKRRKKSRSRDKDDRSDYEVRAVAVRFQNTSCMKKLVSVSVEELLELRSGSSHA